MHATIHTIRLNTLQRAGNACIAMPGSRWSLRRVWHLYGFDPRRHALEEQR